MLEVTVYDENRSVVKYSKYDFLGKVSPAVGPL